MLDGLIFDVDGTLWDSTDLVAKAWNYVLETETTLPADITGELLKTLFGKPMDEICLKIFKGIPVSEHPHLGDICFQKETVHVYSHFQMPKALIRGGLDFFPCFPPRPFPPFPLFVRDRQT